MIDVLVGVVDDLSGVQSADLLKDANLEQVSQFLLGKLNDGPALNGGEFSCSRPSVILFGMRA